MIELQYDLFEPLPDVVTELKQEIVAMNLALDRQRKAMFAKIGASGKEVIAMMEEVHRLKFEVQAMKKMIASN